MLSAMMNKLINSYLLFFTLVNVEFLILIVLSVIDNTRQTRHKNFNTHARVVPFEI